jgi:two-component system, response regulator YesN
MAQCLIYAGYPSNPMVNSDICFAVNTGNLFYTPEPGEYGIMTVERGCSHMLSLIIIDDERGIIELIKNLIDPKRVKVEIVGEAENGVEAYNLILEKHPDVVITDIRMPGMTGIELIEKVSKANLGITFVVISGYRDFDYAQSALKYGAVDYLLKPIKQNDLNNLLVQLGERKENTVAREVKVQSIQEQLAISMDLLRKNTLWDLLSGDQERVHNGLLAIESKTFFHFEPGKFCVALVKIDYTSKSDVEYPTDSIEVIMGKFIRKLKADCFEAEYVCEKAMGYLVFNYAPGKHLSLEQKQQYLHDLLRSDSYKYVFFDITIALGQEETEAGRIFNSYKTALVALYHRIDLGCGNILNYCTLVKEYPKVEVNLADSAKKKLHKCIENLSKQESMEMIHILITDYLRNNQGKAFGLYRYCQDLLGNIDDILFELMGEHVIELNRYEENIENCTTVASMEQCCQDDVAEILKTFIDKKEKKEYKPIRLIKLYIQEHFGEPVSLEDIAQLVHFSPVYVSTVFKKETGMSFTGYLTDVRMGEAKKLLKTSSFSVAEIARIVGYNDVKHFSKLFIKSVGIKPIEFRKFYS